MLRLFFKIFFCRHTRERKCSKIHENVESDGTLKKRKGNEEVEGQENKGARMDERNRENA